MIGGGLEEELAERIKRALERGDPLELVAEVNSFLEERGLGRVIVVGGFAVEIYCARYGGSNTPTPHNDYEHALPPLGAQLPAVQERG